MDSHGRIIRDLRVSLTDRCNFRCLYCLPETEEAANFYRTRFHRTPPGGPGVSSGWRFPDWKPRVEILRFEEIERLVRVFVRLGVRKVRLTGGEPLLRQGLDRLVAALARIDGIEDLALTTNGSLFPKLGRRLKDAGLRRVSFSLDSLDHDNFKRMTGRDGLGEVLNSLALAREFGLRPVKVNAVIIRGLNDHEVENLAAFALREELSLRFIEFMPLDSSRAWQKDHVVPSREILERLRRRFDLRPVAPSHPAETARRWTLNGGPAEVGLIAPVTEPFCGHCNRVRLTADGKVRTCLFSLQEHDLKDRLREGASDESLAGRIRDIIRHKEDRHHIGEPEFVQPQRTMSCIGG